MSPPNLLIPLQILHSTAFNALEYKDETTLRAIAAAARILTTGTPGTPGKDFLLQCNTSEEANAIEADIYRIHNEFLGNPSPEKP